jgi:predicted Zn-dependent peptidase
MVEDSPEEYIHVLSGKAYWGDNPLGRSILGTRENIIGFNSEGIKKFFHHFYQPNRIVISAAGNLEHKRFIDIVGSAFESIRPGDGFPDRITPSGRSTINLHAKKLEQAHVCIGTKGLSIIDSRRYVFSLFNTILGGNMSSRLFQEIRERRGLAYSVFSFISSFADTGMFGVYVGVDPKKAIMSTELILNEMRKLKETRIDSTELHDAKEYTKGNLLLASESVDSQMIRLAQNEIHLKHYIPLQEIIDKIESVTEDEILDLAKSLFQKDQLALTMLGPVDDEKSFKNILAL